MSKCRPETDSVATKTDNSDAVMVCACCAALVTLEPVALYQLKLLPHLVDPPSSLFDSDRIAGSRGAHPFGVPDSLLGLASFGTTLGLILAARHCEPAKKLLGAKLAVDAGAATFNLFRQVVLFRQLCSWCTVTGLAAGGMAYAGRRTIGASLSRIISS